MLKQISFILTILCVFISCKERDHSNPFDPENNDSFYNISLSLNSHDTLITLSWIKPEKPYFNSIDIYKKKETDSDFKLLATVSNSISHYTDIVNEFDVRYSYYIKLNGNDVTSKASEIKSIVPGPGTIWVLDNYLWQILRLNYDLSSVSLIKAGYWRPQNLVLAPKINRGLITYPSFDYFEIFDLNNGQSLYGNTSINKPFDAVYDSGLNLFWLIDTLGSLNAIDTTAYLIHAERLLKKPVQIDILNGELFVLDAARNGIYFFNRSPVQLGFTSKNDQGENFTNLKLFRLDKSNKNLYILDGLPGNNVLYKYNINLKQITRVFQDSLILTFDVNQRDESIWIIIANKLNSELLQLSVNGDRLLRNSDFIYPEDIKVNPYNGNVVLTDMTKPVNIFAQKVFHYKAKTLIGSFGTYGDPFKVYIE